jgi:hypothetical protein
MTLILYQIEFEGPSIMEIESLDSDSRKEFLAAIARKKQDKIDRMTKKAKENMKDKREKSDE